MFDTPETYNIKIEIGDSTVTATLSSSLKNYMSEVTFDREVSAGVLEAVTKVITMGTQELNDSWPQYHSKYYTPDLSSPELVVLKTWLDSTSDHTLSRNNLVFRKKEEAMFVAKKILNALTEETKNK